MNLIKKIKHYCSADQQLLRRQRDVVKRNNLKSLLRSHKKEFLVTAIISFAIGANIATFGDRFMIDKLRNTNFNNEAIISCFYNQSCNQKIINLDINNDKQNIIDVATAYKFKDDLSKSPDLYNNASPELRNKMDKFLELTK